MTNGRRFDARTGDVSDADPNILTFALLDFLDNAQIAAYMGPHSTSTRIAQRMIDAQLLAPEIIKVCLEREVPSECGTHTSAATRFAFIGLQTVVDVDDVGTGLGLADTVNQASPFWYRDRTRIVPALTASPMAWPIA